MFQSIPAGSWLVCVQCDDHAAARRPSCQGGCGGGGAAAAEADRVAGAGAYCSSNTSRYAHG
jgi:hypothetical protein